MFATQLKEHAQFKTLAILHACTIYMTNLHLKYQIRKITIGLCNLDIAHRDFVRCISQCSHVARIIHLFTISAQLAEVGPHINLDDFTELRPLYFVCTSCNQMILLITSDGLLAYFSSLFCFYFRLDSHNIIYLASRKLNEINLNPKYSGLDLGCPIVKLGLAVDLGLACLIVKLRCPTVSKINK